MIAPPELSQGVKDWFQLLVWVSTIVGAIWAIRKGLGEAADSREQRARDLRWKQAEAAKKLNDEMLGDPKADCAMRMIDWNGHDYDIPNAEEDERWVDWAIANAALRTTNLDFDDRETFIRHCYDAFFGYLAQFEHYIVNDFVKFDDVTFPVEYYVKRMGYRKAVFETYMRTYDFDRALRFVERFPKWRMPETMPPEFRDAATPTPKEKS